MLKIIDSINDVANKFNIDRKRMKNILLSVKEKPTGAKRKRVDGGGRESR